MIKLLTQTTEFYCSTSEEAEETLQNRKTESNGKIAKHTIEDKGNYTKLTVKEEYNLAIELAKQEPTDNNDYYEILDEDLNLIEHSAIEHKESE